MLKHFLLTSHLSKHYWNCLKIIRIWVKLKADPLTLELIFFCDIKGWGGGGLHRKTSKIAIGQFKALTSWPYTNNFTIEHPE